LGSLIAIIIIMGLLLFSIFLPRQTYADILTNSLTQRIGNYNVDMKTAPPNPLAGQTTEILFKISTVNGEDLVDQPIMINISKDGVREETTHPIFVPYGHYTHEFVFKESGLYALDLAILNDPDTGENITFEFPLHVYNLFGEYFAFSPASPSSLPVGYDIIIAILAVSGIVFLLRMRNKGRKRVQHDAQNGSSR
jgi:hypothetical protein